MTIDEARRGLKFAVKVIRIIRAQQTHGPTPISEIWRQQAAERIKACRAVIKTYDAQRAQRKAA